MKRCCTLVALALSSLALLALPASAAPKRALFDNTKAETSGNADWIIDTDQPLPVPDQGTITAASPRTTWLGAISSYGIDLVKRGYFVATLTATYGITYNNPANPYDLSKYDVFIVPEPQGPFSAAESTAIFNFVRDGGGLIAIADHHISDRNGDGWDSPMVWNDLDALKLWGVHWGTAGDANNNIVQDSGNHATAPSDSIIFGPNGVADSLSFHNGTTLFLYPGINPQVRGEVWMKGLAQSSTTGVMAASSVYGNGRIFMIGDSSPVDDGSAQPGNSSIFDGWGEAAGRDSLLFLNATMWATRRDPPAGDTSAPSVSVTSPNGGETWKAGSSQSITWTATDAVGVTSADVAWSGDGGASWTSLASGIANTGAYAWTVPDSPTSTARVRVRARDAAGNLGADSSATDFTIDRWIILATAGPGGTVSPSGSVGVAQGGSRTFSIRPDLGHHVATLTVDGGAVPPDTTFSFTNVLGPRTLAATFEGDPFSLTVSLAGSGAVTRTPDLAVYLYGTSVRLIAAPAAGWAFAGWSGDASGVSDTALVVIDAAKSVTAAFTDVAAPVVTLLAPLGGEQWIFGDQRTLRWTATDNAGVDSVDVDVSYHGGAGPWEPLVHALTGADSLGWTVPSVATDSALIRVTAFDHALNQSAAVSPSLFRIAAPASADGGAPGLWFARPAPNPSRGEVRFAFSLPRAGAVTVDVLDVSGRRLATVANGAFPAGAHSLRWDGRDGAGSLAPAGVYFARFVTPGAAVTRRFVRMQ